MTGLIYKVLFRFNIMIEISLFSLLEASHVKDLSDRVTMPVQE